MYQQLKFSMGPVHEQYFRWGFNWTHSLVGLRGSISCNWCISLLSQAHLMPNWTRTLQAHFLSFRTTANILRFITARVMTEENHSDGAPNHQWVLHNVYVQLKVIKENYSHADKSTWTSSTLVCHIMWLPVLSARATGINHNCTSVFVLTIVLKKYSTVMQCKNLKISLVTHFQYPTKHLTKGVTLSTWWHCRMKPVLLALLECSLQTGPRGQTVAGIGFNL
jgi:hypothetical protein